MNPVLDRSVLDEPKSARIDPREAAPQVDSAADASEHDLPRHLLRDLGPIRSTTSDPALRRIARLLRLHPEIDRQYTETDLRRLSEPERLAMLKDIEDRLGIR